MGLYFTGPFIVALHVTTNVSFSSFVFISLLDVDYKFNSSKYEYKRATLDTSSDLSSISQHYSLPFSRALYASMAAKELYREIRNGVTTLVASWVCTQDDKWDEDIKPGTFLSIYARPFTSGSALIEMPPSRGKSIALKCK